MEDNTVNYFFAGFSWIANAGVVPWLLFFAFLFAPAFFSLFARRASVTLVLDTIYELLNLIVSIRSRFLPIRVQYVKTLFLLISFIYISSIHAAESWIISKGEHRELHFPDIVSYSISNKDVVAHKMRKKSKKILIKGRKLGYSELIIWQRSGKHTIIQIYVLSKQKQLNILHLAQTLRSLGLDTSTAGPLITVTGIIDEFKNYLLLKKLKIHNKDSLHLKVELSKKLKNYIVGEIYRLLFDEYIDDIWCEARFTSILCQYPKSNPPTTKLIKYLEKHFFVDLVPIHNLQALKNYRISMKLILLEKLNGTDINWGLSKLDAPLNLLFNNGISALVANNRIFLNENNIDLSSLAEPQMVLTVDKDAMVQVGADIPYKQGVTGSDQLTTSWKFAGLKVKFHLAKIGKSVQISYQTEFTKPTENGISGSKQKSVFTTSIGVPQQIFEIGFQTSGVHSSSIPVLGKIPILGHLFKSKSHQQNYKKIIGIIKLDPYESPTK